MAFHAIYFDGKRKEGYVALISVSNTGLRISYSDGIAKTIEWDAGKIQSNDLDENSKVYLKYGSSPMQYLEVSDMGLIKELKANFPEALCQKRTSGFMLSSGF